MEIRGSRERVMLLTSMENDTVGEQGRRKRVTHEKCAGTCAPEKEMI